MKKTALKYKTRKSSKRRRWANLFGFLSSSKSYRRNLDMMKILVSDYNFKKILAEIRAHLQLPPDGFPKKISDKRRQWYEKLLEQSNKMLESQGFRDQVSLIRQKFQKGEIGSRMANKQLNLLYEKVPLQYLHIRARFIIDRFNLPVHFQPFVECYIVSSVIDAPQHNYKPAFYPPGVSPLEARYLPINIYTRLTKDEVEELRQYIQWAGYNLPQYQTLKNVDTKLEIEKWYEHRDVVDAGDNKPHRMSNREIAENLLGDRRKDKKVYDAQRELRRLRTQRFKVRKIG